MRVPVCDCENLWVAPVGYGRCKCRGCGREWEWDVRTDDWEVVKGPDERSTNALEPVHPWPRPENVPRPEPDKRLLTFSVYEPKPWDDHRFTAEQVRGAVVAFMDKHGGSFVESRVVTEPERIGDTDVEPGTVVVTMRVDDDDLWRRIKSGEINHVTANWDPRERTMRKSESKRGWLRIRKGGVNPSPPEGVRVPPPPPPQRRPPKGGTAAVKPPPGWVPNPGGSAVVPPSWSPKTDEDYWQTPARIQADRHGVRFSCRCGRLHEADGKYHLCDCGAELHPLVDSMGYMVTFTPKLDQATADKLTNFFERGKGKATGRIQVVEADPPKGLMLVGSGKPEFVSTPRADLRTVIDAMDCAVKKAAESRPLKLSVKVPASTGPTSEPRTLETFEDFVDAYGGTRKPAPTRSRHQARLARRSGQRPLPGDKRAPRERKRRRWFWAAVLVLLTVISGVAGALTIYDRWPESVPKHRLLDSVKPYATRGVRCSPDCYDDCVYCVCDGYLDGVRSVSFRAPWCADKETP